MIHLELLHLSPVKGIALMRIYSGVPQDQPAYLHRLDFDYTCVVVWRPHRHTGEIKGMRGNTASLHREVPLILNYLHGHLGLTHLWWERASGKRVDRYRSPRGRWVSKPPMKLVDITSVSG